MAIFQPRRDVVAYGALDTAADHPAVAVFRCGSEAGRTIERGSHTRVGVAAARVEQRVVGHEVTGPRGEIERALGIDRDERGARIADNAVVGAELNTGLGATYHERADLVVLTCEHATRERVLGAADRPEKRRIGTTG